MTKKKTKLDINKLINHPLILKTELSKMIWPDIKPESANSKLNQKLNGRNYHKFLPKDIERIEKVFNDFLNDVQE